MSLLFCRESVTLAAVSGFLKGSLYGGRTDIGLSSS